MNFKDLKQISYITENLPKIETLIIGIFLLLFIYQEFDNFLGEFFNLKIRGLIYLLLLIGWISFWSINKFYLPRNKKNKIGIVISFYTENQKERQKLKTDFINVFKQKLQEENKLPFKTIFLKNHLAQKIIESDNQKETIKKFNKKIKAHFYIYGDVKKRQDGDDIKYFLAFHGLIIHNSISKDLKKNILEDFSKIFPGEINFLEKKSLKGFKISANHLHLATEYMIGMAAFISRDPLLASKLHGHFKKQLNNFKSLSPSLKDIRSRMPYLISNELFLASWLFFEKKEYKKAKEYIIKSLEENNNNYNSWLLKTTIDFVFDKDIESAFKSIKKAEKYAKNDPSWIYSKAFLYFWTSNFKKALNLCGKIKKQNYPSENKIIERVYIFNEPFLKEKPQLYFWIGYLNYFKEKNLTNALKNFENFERYASNNMSELQQKSSAYLIEIKQKLKKNNKKQSKTETKI